LEIVHRFERQRQQRTKNWGKKKLEETLLGYFKTRCPEEQAIAHTAEALKFIHKSLKQKVVTSICVTYPTVSKKRKEELDEEDEEDE